MKALFTPNPTCLPALKDCTPGSSYKEYVIEEVVEIPLPEYRDFLDDFTAGYDLYVYYSGRMFIDSDGIFHCILITVSGATDGILVATDNAARIGNAAYWEYRKNLPGGE